MVCIDEVVAYFKTLKSYERLWMMCRLQSHCLPIELRYLGTCLDNLSKRDVHVLKKLELEANDPANVGQVARKCICDKTVRAAVIKYLSVLNANSAKCSELIYKALTDDKALERVFKSPRAFFSDKNAFEELMVLYTLAVNHPAFSFEQKTQLDSIFNCIKKEKERQASKNKDSDSDSKDSSKSFESINTMIPPPNYLYQQTHGGSNFPLNRNGYVYPRHFFPCPPMNVPPMQVCHDYPPPAGPPPPPTPQVISAIRGPHQASFTKSPSPVSWPPPRTFQINNPRSQAPPPPPNSATKQRHPTPPRFRSPPDAGLPFPQSWNSWNMYQMSPQNMYTNYNFSPSVVPPFYHDNAAARTFQGHGAKPKHVPLTNRSQDQFKAQTPVSVPCTPPLKQPPSATIKNGKPPMQISTNVEKDNDSSLDAHDQVASSDCSKSNEVNQPGSIRPAVPPASLADKIASKTSVQTPYMGPKPIQYQTPPPGAAKPYNQKTIVADNKNNTDNVQIPSKVNLAASQKTYPPAKVQPDHGKDTQQPHVTPNQGHAINEQTTNIDLSTLSAALVDENKTTDNATAPTITKDANEKSSQPKSDNVQQTTKIGPAVETNLKVCEGKETATGGSIKPPIVSTTVANTYSLHNTKYYKGRPIQSQMRNVGRDNNGSAYNYNRKSLAAAVPPYNESHRDNAASKLHPKGGVNNSGCGQHYYTMAYDNGSGPRPYNTQTYYVHQSPGPQPMPTYQSVPRPYVQQQHVVQSPEYQPMYQPTEFVYYPSTSQTFYTTPVLMQPPVLTYHPPKVSCYNCGGQNHTGAECTELTMEEITSKGLYEHHYGAPTSDGRHHHN
ncbi:uncharacterized protein LOC126836628 isoform X2 [Adelges cooleyi]|uniref:uncharacterized protein LOC126836628 isoform X2 n=1 Tax=Adelges cooleyi TaxID=133065 RepID=UPI00217F32E6|nr:uncharacterized protein LOC126836628 isoform X2 [Adelges cooleyi]